MKRSVSITNWALCSALAAMLFISCVFDTSDPFYYDNLFKKEYEYCRAFLDRHFYYRDSLPDSLENFSSVDSLYLSVHEPNTQYVTRSDAKKFLQRFKSAADTSLGILVDSVHPGVVISYVYPGSVADGARLAVFDTILCVDSTVLSGMDMNTILGKLSRQTGLTKILRYKRDTVTIQDTLKIGEYFLPPVFCDSINSDVFYLYVSSFVDTPISSKITAQEIEAALKSSSWAAYTIIDLRDNPGGDFGQGIMTASKFVPSQSGILRTREWVVDTLRDSLISDADTVDFSTRTFYLLTDDVTAAASEIVVSAIRRNVPASKIVGSKTYGFGVLSIVSPTPDSGYAAVTCAELFTITGEPYKNNGIIPDISVPADKDALEYALNEIDTDILIQNPALITHISRIKEKYRPANKIQFCTRWIKNPAK